MPTEEKVARKLRAILSADLKGYSLLMSDDEASTVKTLKSYRKVMSNPKSHLISELLRIIHIPLLLYLKPLNKVVLWPGKILNIN